MAGGEGAVHGREEVYVAVEISVAAPVAAAEVRVCEGGAWRGDQETTGLAHKDAVDPPEDN